jgi:hypothetical protein
MTMLAHGHSEQTDFWSDVYRGKTIAILNHYGRLYVYLDHMLQHHVVFADRVDARAWLTRRIDEEVVKDASPPIGYVDASSEEAGVSNGKWPRTGGQDHFQLRVGECTTQPA